MPTTPDFWKLATKANVFDSDARRHPDIVGLSNGNYLVVWADDNDTAANGAGTDILGQFYSIEFEPIGGNIFLNETFGANRTEQYPTISVTDDGGFVLLYDYRKGSDDDILFTRFDSSGNRTVGTFAVNDKSSSVTDSVREAHFRESGANTVVLYERSEGGAAVRVLSSNGNLNAAATIGAEGSFSSDMQADRTVLVVYNRTIGATERVYMTRIGPGNSLTTLKVGNTFNDPSVKPLAVATEDGGFAIIYWSTSGFAVGEKYASNDVREGELTLLGAIYDPESSDWDAVALRGGGFFLPWIDDTTNAPKGQRFGNDLSTVGSQVTGIARFDVASDVALDMTADGRILAARA